MLPETAKESPLFEVVELEFVLLLMLAPVELPNCIVGEHETDEMGDEQMLLVGECIELKDEQLLLLLDRDEVEVEDEDDDVDVEDEFEDNEEVRDELPALFGLDFEELEEELGVMADVTTKLTREPAGLPASGDIEEQDETELEELTDDRLRFVETVGVEFELGRLIWWLDSLACDPAECCFRPDFSDVSILGSKAIKQDESELSFSRLSGDKLASKFN